MEVRRSRANFGWRSLGLGPTLYGLRLPVADGWRIAGPSRRPSEVTAGDAGRRVGRKRVDPSRRTGEGGIQLVLPAFLVLVLEGQTPVAAGKQKLEF
ncbi:hypothetical protein NL676_034481 [Syzygium grande]|nr:hypothetical protein NL676_034481 [Syzygium grande]